MARMVDPGASSSPGGASSVRFISQDERSARGDRSSVISTQTPTIAPPTQPLAD